MMMRLSAVPLDDSTSIKDIPFTVVIAELGTSSTLVLNGIVRVTVTVMPDLSVYSFSAAALADSARSCLKAELLAEVKPSRGVKLLEGEKPLPGVKLAELNPLGGVKLPENVGRVDVCVVATAFNEVTSTVTG